MEIKSVLKSIKNKYNSLVFTRKKYGSVIDEFHKLYYDSERWRLTKWMGIETQKCPLDMWIYQEIIHEIKPDIIIETGTRYGGSALYMAGLLDALGNGKVISVDTVKEDFPKHDRIEYICGSSASLMILNMIKNKIKPTDRVLVILDSDHSRKHVSEEMKLYSELVTNGSYMIVEDSNIGGNPVAIKDEGNSPMDSIIDFLKVNQDFVIDDSREKLFLTFNPKGYLKKVKKK